MGIAPQITGNSTVQGLNQANKIEKSSALLALCEGSPLRWSLPCVTRPSSPMESTIYITVTSQWARGRLKSPAYLLFAQPFVQAQIKENIKAPRHWPLWGNSPVTGEFPAQRASHVEMFPFDDVIMVDVRVMFLQWTRTQKRRHKAFFLSYYVQYCVIFDGDIYISRVYSRSWPSTLPITIDDTRLSCS